MGLVTILALGLVIGLILGGLGGGGAILTVPALVYIVGQPAQEATTSSLVIVGLTAAVGVLSYVRAARVRWGLGLAFGLLGLPATWLGTFLNHRVNEHLLLLGFSVLMLGAAAAMVADRTKQAPEPDARPARAVAPNRLPAEPSFGAQAPKAATTSLLERPATTETTSSRPSPLAVILAALAVGLLTGFFGVGGGFVIVPALVLVLRVPMQQAVGTSLMIVALNSATSLLARAGTAHFDWEVIVPFTLAAVVATLAGKRVADRLPARQLKIGFAALLILVGGYTAWQSVDGLLASDSAPSAAAADSAIVSPATVEQALAGGAIALDVRTPAEYDAGHLDGARNLDINAPDFDTLLNELDPQATYVVYCASGRRATLAIDRMEQAGFDDLLNGGGFSDLASSGLLTTS